MKRKCHDHKYTPSIPTRGFRGGKQHEILSYTTPLAMKFPMILLITCFFVASLDNSDKIAPVDYTLIQYIDYRHFLATPAHPPSFATSTVFVRLPHASKPHTITTLDFFRFSHENIFFLSLWYKGRSATTRDTVFSLVRTAKGNHTCSCPRFPNLCLRSRRAVGVSGPEFDLKFFPFDRLSMGVFLEHYFFV